MMQARMVAGSLGPKGEQFHRIGWFCCCHTLATPSSRRDGPNVYLPESQIDLDIRLEGLTNALAVGRGSNGVER